MQITNLFRPEFINTDRLAEDLRSYEDAHEDIQEFYDAFNVFSKTAFKDARACTNPIEIIFGKFFGAFGPSTDGFRPVFKGNIVAARRLYKQKNYEALFQMIANPYRVDIERVTEFMYFFINEFSKML